MSIIQIQKTKCINAFCDKELDEFELERLCTFFNKYRYCRNCRGRVTTLGTTICVDCGGRIHNNTAKLYCTVCIKKRKSKNSLVNYHTKKKLKGREQKTNTVLKFLKTNKIATQKKIAEELNMTPGAIRTCIYTLRHNRGIKIRNVELGYMIQ